MVGAAAGIYFTVRLLPLATWLDQLQSVLRELGLVGAFLFAAVYVVATLLLVPGSVITLAVGAMYGLGWGTALVSLAATTSAALAFLLAKTFLRSHIKRKADGNPRFAAVDRAVAKGGWRMVFLLRLSPAIPFSLSNYLYGLTSIRFTPYVLASWIAMLPGTFLYVYLGHAGREGAALAKGESGKTTYEWLLLGAGLIATLVVTIYVTRLAKRELSQETDGSSE